MTFLDGDPDRPLVVGCLYNGDNHHPFPVPEHRSQSGWRTRTHPKGQVLNAFVFEDKDGAEEIYTYAGRNYRREVVKDEDVDIGGQRTTRIGKDESRVIEGARRTEVGKDRQSHISGSDHTVVDQHAQLDVGDGLGVRVRGDIKVDGESATRMVMNGPLIVESKMLLVFEVGGNRIEMSPAGIIINGVLVKIN